MRTPFTGVGTALVTPFAKDGSLDEAAVRRLARRQIDAGVHFLSPCGTTGEASTLSHDEKVRVVRLVVEEADGKVPVLAGAGGYDTRKVIALVSDLQAAGADGILSVTPYYTRPTPEGLYQHYRAIAESTSLPIVLYNVPGRTGVNLDVATVARLSAIPNIAGVKEASGNVVQMCEIYAAVPDDFRQRFLRKVGTDAAPEYEVVDQLRQRVRFMAMNLLEAGGFRPSHDVIFCHNVLIYFAPDAVTRVVARLASCLTLGGYLLLGPGEAPNGRPPGLEPVNVSGVRAFQRKTVRPVEVPA